MKRLRRLIKSKKAILIHPMLMPGRLSALKLEKPGLMSDNKMVSRY